MLGAIIAGVLISGNAVDFTLNDTDGNQVTLSSLTANGPVLMVFWATWCNDCKDLLDYAQQLYSSKKDKGLTVLGISQDSPRKLSQVKDTKQGHGWQYPVLLDPNKAVSLKYKAMAVPVTVIVDKNMNVVYQRIGFTAGQEGEIEAKVSELLGE